MWRAAYAPSLPWHNSSTDLPSELPAELLSAPLIWVRPFSHSTTAPTRSFTAAPAPSPSESGCGTRWSPSAALRLARPWTLCLAARVAAVDRRACNQVVWPQTSRSHFQTHWFLCLLLHRRHHEKVPEPFSYLQGGFCMPGPAAPSQPPQIQYPSRQRAPPKRLDL
jgi:hypothetical protein